MKASKQAHTHTHTESYIFGRTWGLGCATWSTDPTDGRGELEAHVVTVAFEGGGGGGGGWFSYTNTKAQI